MLSYSAKRLAVAVPTLLLLIILSFLLMHAAPGGPFTQEKALPPQVLANLNAKYGLDQPVWRQMVSYVWGIVAHFDFGPSFVYKDRTVNEIIAQERRVSPADIEPMRIRPPVKPVTLQELAALESTSFKD